MDEKQRFEAVMRANGPQIYTLAVRLCGNESDGADVAQETFVKAWKSWSQFRGEAMASTWLYRICVNVWKNRVRYEKRRSFWKHFSLDGLYKEEDSAPREFASPEAPLGASLEQRETQKSIQQAMANLGAEDRAILVMFEIDEKSYEEIAECLDVPVGTVRSRLSRAREKLTRTYLASSPQAVGGDPSDKTT